MILFIKVIKIQRFYSPKRKYNIYIYIYKYIHTYIYTYTCIDTYALCTHECTCINNNNNHTNNVTTFFWYQSVWNDNLGVEHACFQWRVKSISRLLHKTNSRKRIEKNSTSSGKKTCNKIGSTFEWLHQMYRLMLYNYIDLHCKLGIALVLLLDITLLLKSCTHYRL